MVNVGKLTSVLRSGRMRREYFEFQLGFLEVHVTQLLLFLNMSFCLLNSSALLAAKI